MDNVETHLLSVHGIDDRRKQHVVVVFSTSQAFELTHEHLSVNKIYQLLQYKSTQEIVTQYTKQVLRLSRPSYHNLNTLLTKHFHHIFQLTLSSSSLSHSTAHAHFRRRSGADRRIWCARGQLRRKHRETDIYILFLRHITDPLHKWRLNLNNYTYTS